MGNLQRLSVTWETCCQKTRKVDFFFFLSPARWESNVVVGGGGGGGERVETFPKKLCVAAVRGGGAWASARAAPLRFDEK